MSNFWTTPPRYRRFQTDRPEQLSANKPDFVTANKLQFETTVHMDSGIRRAG